MTTIEAPVHHDAAAAFIDRPHKLFIGGRWVDAVEGKQFATINPADGQVLGHVAHGTEQDIDLAVRSAREAFAWNSPWRTMTPSQRGRVLHKIGDLILENAEELAMLETLDNGKPYSMALAADIPFAADVFHYMSGWATKIEGSTIPVGQDLMVMAQKEAVGVAGIVIAWNYPLLLCAWKLGPALAAGCTAVVKPAEQTPLSALRLAELMQEAGLPDGVVNVVTGYGDAGAALTAHPDVDKVSFTGSTEVGKKIVHAAAGNLKKLTLELGGKSPNVVFNDADLATAVPAASNAIFLNQGQACNAGSRLYVERGIFDEFVTGVSEFAQGIQLGPGADPATQMGPLVSDVQLERVLGYLKDGQEQGAVAVTGGARWGDSGYFVAPTVLTETHQDMAVVQEEVFGPVVVAMPFDDPAEIIATANDTVYGLAAGVFTRDISKAYRTAAQLKAGSVYINTYHAFNAAVPFGGFKQSGWGRDLGREAVEGFLETKSVFTAL